MSSLEEIRKSPCPAGGSHQLELEKSEEFPDGTVKKIYVCTKCKSHFEVEEY